MAHLKKANAKIENVVATADVGHTIDLNSIAREIPSVEYRPELFPGLCLRLKKPKASLSYSELEKWYALERSLRSKQKGQ